MIRCIFSLLVASAMSCGCEREYVVATPIVEPAILPKIVQPIEPVNSFTPERIVDLYAIAIALEKYKQENNSYPLSSGDSSDPRENNWDSILNFGRTESGWIIGLVPKYLHDLPADPREDKLPEHQYLYKSNGAHYKLIARNPEDYGIVKARAPVFMDYRSEGNNYGIWTSGAKGWGF